MERSTRSTPGPRQWRATYRVQLTPDFGFPSAAGIVPYLAHLGISHLYVSPILAARPGSTHGYDVVDPTRINDELGGAAGFERLSEALEAEGMGLLVDIVPNHMAAIEQNAWWWDVLKHGQSSAFAGVFDVDWARGSGKVVLPVLGGTLEEMCSKGELEVGERLGEPALNYHGRSFPLAPGTLPGSGTSGADLGALAMSQHYRLAYWRHGLTEINYRRFFDVSDLVALRQDSDRVFDLTHALLLDLVRRGHVHGFRVDHIDGLADPGAYLTRLRRAVDGVRPHREVVFPIYVEKILARDEELRADWPVDGTTGYEVMNRLTRALVDPAGVETMRRLARERGAVSRTFGDVVRASKVEVAEALFPSELSSLAESLAGLLTARGVAPTLEEAKGAVLRLTAAVGVYRTYAATPSATKADQGRIDAAVNQAVSNSRAHGRIGPALREILLGPRSPEEIDWVRRWEQFTGPVMAKGLEDTALYRHVVLASLNEVGGWADLGDAPAAAELHERASVTAVRWPRTLNATSTHDTKRSEDVRARLDVLSEMPEAWDRAVGRMRAAVGLDRIEASDETLFWQALIGVWPLEGGPDESLPRRVGDYAVKAAREAKKRTSWLAPDEAYENQLRSLAERASVHPEVRSVMGGLLEEIGPASCVKGLAQLALKCVLPGVPDFYQGTESWDLSLVDPDNRRAVDFERLSGLLGETHPGSADGASRALLRWHSGSLKIFATRVLLACRAACPDLFARGAHVALGLEGDAHAEQGIFAMARVLGEHRCVLVVPRRVLGVLHHSAPRVDAHAWRARWPGGLRLPWSGRTLWRNEFTGQDVGAQAELDVAGLLGGFPVILLTSRKG